MTKKRVISPSGYYHLIQKGVNEQNIYLEDKDKLVFLKLLSKYVNKYRITIIAFTLMNNHYHLFIRDNACSVCNVSFFMRDLNSCYAKYFNRKYGRRGHLFMSTYSGLHVDSVKYAKTLIRYIHRNAVEAKIVQKAEHYKWSSYQFYLRKKSLFAIKNAVSFKIDMSFYENMSHLEIKAFTENHKSLAEQYYSEGDHKYFLNDKQAADKIKAASKISNFKKFAQLDANELQQALSVLCKIKGISYKQISRITGISYTIVRTIANKAMKGRPNPNEPVC